MDNSAEKAWKDIEKLTEGDNELEEFIIQEPIKNILLAFNNTVCEKLVAIESKVDCLTDYCQMLEEKVEILSSLVKENTSHTIVTSAGSPGSVSSDDGVASVTLGSNVTLITLNTEADYPNGSWLGDESNPEMRVRCHISATDLFHINTTCNSPEKMALTLLDYLFDRETQACSNISGTGKHNKKQLDPLMIYGVRCHLIHKFNVTSADWNRIKQNLDSKCRTAFRRKQKGLPLTSKGSFSSHRTDPSSPHICNIALNPVDGTISTVAVACDSLNNLTEGDVAVQSTFQLQPSTSPADQQELTAIMQDSQNIRTQHGNIQVLHATAEQLVEIQQTHQIQILTGGHILATPVEEDTLLVEDTVSSVKFQEIKTEKKSL